MNYNLPTKVRFAIYLFFAVGSIIVAYLADVQVVDAAFVKAWVQLTVLGNGLAAINTSQSVGKSK